MWRCTGREFHERGIEDESRSPFTSRQALLVSKMELRYALSVGNQQADMERKTDVPQGTLALMALKTLHVLGAAKAEDFQ